MKTIPVYGDMNSFPYKSDQKPSSQYHHPSWEAVPPQMKDGPSSCSCTHESWPPNYSYPVPMQCHNCCTHGQYPVYHNFRPPCSHFPPPPPPPYHYFYGGYPPYPQSYPMYYSPPQHYSMELPRYEYEKSVPRDQFHCCGCLNHPGHVKGGNNVKIEEQDTDAEMKKSESSFPARANNFPHPIMWIPPEYIMNKEQPKRLVENEENQQHVLPYLEKPQVQQRPIDTEAQKNKGIQSSKKPHQSVRSTEQDPNSQYGWFPLDINSIKQLMEGGDSKQTREQEISKDEKKAPDVENKDQNKQLSYPMFWIPYDRREEDSAKGQMENTAGGTAIEGSPSAHNILPRKIEHTDNEPETQSAAGVDDSRIETMGGDKKRIVRTIPVKQLEESSPKFSKKEEEHKRDTAKNDTSVQSSSSTKKPKLPPVCLRIDPPKKKKGNGSFKSPSSGEKMQQGSDELNLERKSEQQHKEIKVKDAEKSYSQNKIEVSCGTEEDSDFLKDKYKSADVKRVDDIGETQDLRAVKESEFHQESKQKRKVMSEREAAVTIQAACRGHDVRRSEPIKKLKEIAKVQEQAIQVRKHLEDLESRAPVHDKEKATVGEIIMKLLLELDSMQGLHQSVRDVRRSVAKELISLQEKLDSIMSQQSVVLAQDISTAPAVEEPPKDYGLVEGSGVTVDSAGQPIKDLCPDGDKNLNTDEGRIYSSSDLSSSGPLPCQDGVSGLENGEISEDSLADMAARSYGDIAPPSLDLKMKEVPNVTETAEETSLMEFQKPIVDTSPVEDTLAQNDLESCSKNEEVNMLSELPREVDIAVDDGVSGFENREISKDSLVNMAARSDGDITPLSLDLKMKEEPDVTETAEETSPMEFQKTVVVTSPVEDTPAQNDLESCNRNEEANMLSELPREVVGIAVDDGLLTGNNEQDQNLLMELHQDVDDKSSTNVSIVEDRAVENDMVTGNVDHKSDNMSELSKDVVEEDKKGDVKLPDHDLRYFDKKDDVKPPHDYAGSASKMEKEEQEVNLLHNLSAEVNNDDGENLNKDLVLNHPSENTKVDYQDRKTENCEQELPVGTPNPEPEMQQSKEEDGAFGRSLEGQSTVVAGETGEQIDKKVIEENEKLRAMLEKLLADGKEQQQLISSLNGKVKDLEKKLDRRKNKKMTKFPRVRVSRPLCGKPVNDSLRVRPTDIES